MGTAIGQSLPIAAGIALSPIPIIAVVLMLTSSRAAVNGPLFVVGWLVGMGIVGVIVLSVAGQAGASRSGAPTGWVAWLKLALGVLLLVVAVRQFRGRPKETDEPPMPKWMASVDRTTPIAAAGLGLLSSGANPKNLLLAVSGATAIAQTGIPGGEQVVAYVVFTVIGTLGVAIPVGVQVALGARSATLLARLKDWMGRYNAVIMSVLCLVFGVKVIGDAISGLA
ncbi:MAG TPA: GAP family protein [Pseudonocardiaceae bacterium]|jgi:cytochrome c biogenesis protein CcdA|nr:GAP family protein [Pseudonocardiaceae bacterium]